MTAIEQLDLWLVYQRYWTEHKPSVTITVRDEEWLDVGAFVYRNFNEMSGVSFLPYSDHIYKQAPYQDCDEKTYNELKKELPDNVDWSLLSKYENTDMTEGAQELACVSGVCEI